MCKFAGMYIAAGRTQSAYSKNDAFSKLERPNEWVDICILIDIFLFYRQLLPLHELGIILWINILSKHPQQGNYHKRSIWN